jgi:hypothetical protein
VKRRRIIEEEERNRERLLWLANHPGAKPRDYRRIKNTPAVREWHDARREAHTALVRQAWQRDHPGRPYPEREHFLTTRYLAYFLRWHRAYTRQLLASRRRAR